jgi:TrmH RNA methyltransferase
MEREPRRGREPLEAVYGLRAALAVLARRPEDVVRVAFTRAARQEVAPLRSRARAAAFDEVPEGELDRLTESRQNEGLCVWARPRRWASTVELGDVLARVGGVAVALERVRNPYNVGAVLRSAAFFGVDAAILGTPAPHPGLPPLAVRVAEGGAEYVLLARTTDLADTLSRLRARGVRVVGTDGRAPAGALGFAYPRPLVVVVGNEREGLADRVRAQCDALVAVRGSGRIESLNVGVAAGVVLAEAMSAASDPRRAEKSGVDERRGRARPT